MPEDLAGRRHRRGGVDSEVHSRYFLQATPRTWIFVRVAFRTARLVGGARTRASYPEAFESTQSSPRRKSRYCIGDSSHAFEARSAAMSTSRSS